ncbi:diaminobutyrate acetyltransferase [Streptomyces alboniger]|uniref:L-2,4-diaminobutyric acid acetyltransferase n=1 Tax=Streptomyces alboniger TaxID=132473 RepID=A0A5J6HCI1_STRAD|nr:diaminobutyrate acetyltransferase [Streptomyces alboniger]QEV16270.1 diaminobutyrate acetyltransferase [Streptomyces alboniger]
MPRPTPRHPATGDSPSPSGVTLRQPIAGDAAAMWRLVRDTANLDTNSPHFYLMWCRDFAASSIVASSEEDLCGFTAGFTRPDSPDTLFVWQTAVSPLWQGVGLAGRMLDRLVADTYRFVECTITPDNQASDRYMHAFARNRQAALQQRPLFPSEDFPEPGHDPEILYRIGPLPPLA